MEERTHAWIALRTVALLEDAHAAAGLVSLLKGHARKATVGAWIPDQTDAKRGGGATDNHVLKILPYKGSLSARFVMDKPALLKQIGPHRRTAGFIQADTTLDAAWWKTPYKGDVSRPGQHLPNRCMALSLVLKDMLLLGDDSVDKLLPGTVKFHDKIEAAAMSREEEIALHCFMLSHFVADISMPCHCDGRHCSGYANGLHKELEEHWGDNIVGNGYRKANLLKAGAPDGDALFKEVRAVDAKAGITFCNQVPGLLPSHDVWLETMQLARASFAVAGMMVPPVKCPYDKPGCTAPFKDVFAGAAGRKLLDGITAAALHDAVLNTAIIWLDIWNDASGKGSKADDGEG